MSPIFIGAAIAGANAARRRQPLQSDFSAGPSSEIYWKIGNDKREFDSLQSAVYQNGITVPQDLRLKVTQFEADNGFSIKRATRSGLAGAARILASLVPGASSSGLAASLQDFAERKSERGEFIREGEIFLGPAPQNPARLAVLYVETEGPVPSHRGQQPAFIAFSRA